MIVPSQKHAFLALIVILIYLIFQFRDRVPVWSHRVHDSGGREVHDGENTNDNSIWGAFTVHNVTNSDTRCEEDGVANDGEPPEIIQCSMKWGGMEPIYHMAMDTHLQHGCKWGYPTHHLDHEIVGQGNIEIGI